MPFTDEERRDWHREKSEREHKPHVENRANPWPPASTAISSLATARERLRKTSCFVTDVIPISIADDPHSRVLCDDRFPPIADVSGLGPLPPQKPDTSSGTLIGYR
jgi:hypothetical protein